MIFTFKQQQHFDAKAAFGTKFHAVWQLPVCVVTASACKVLASSDATVKWSAMSPLALGVMRSLTIVCVLSVLVREALKWIMAIAKLISIKTNMHLQ